MEDQKDSFVEFPVEVVDLMTEQVRCIEVPDGQLYYEFRLPGGKRSSRVLADQYDTALRIAKEKRIVLGPQSQPEGGTSRRNP
jgi:hypothetical protein